MKAIIIGILAAILIAGFFIVKRIKKNKTKKVINGTNFIKKDDNSGGAGGDHEFDNN